MIRKATIKDIPAIREIADIAFPETYKDIHTPKQTEYMMEKMYSESSLTEQMTQLGHTFLIEDGVGYISFWQDEKAEETKHVFHIEKFYILPQFQGEGYGRALFEKVIETIKKSVDGPFQIQLNVNRANKAVTFYEHLGMYKYKSGDYSFGGGFVKNDYVMAMDF